MFVCVCVPPAMRTNLRTCFFPFANRRQQTQRSILYAIYGLLVSHRTTPRPYQSLPTNPGVRSLRRSAGVPVWLRFSARARSCCCCGVCFIERNLSTAMLPSCGPIERATEVCILKGTHINRSTSNGRLLKGFGFFKGSGNRLF